MAMCGREKFRERVRPTVAIRGEEWARAKGSASVFLLEIHISLREICISVFDLDISLGETCISLTEICISFREIHKSAFDFGK